MYIKSGDIFNNYEALTSNKIRHILDLLDNYIKIPYTICEIRQENFNDKNNRIDVEIEYEDYLNHNCRIRQKLLIFKDEVIDGLTFHKRFHEWYE